MAHQNLSDLLIFLLQVLEVVASSRAGCSDTPSCTKSRLDQSAKAIVAAFELTGVAVVVESAEAVEAVEQEEVAGKWMAEELREAAVREVWRSRQSRCCD